VRAGDLACVIMTHLHRDHAGHLDKVPMHVPVVVNRSEMASACSGVQGTAYARDDIHHLLDRVYTPGALRFLDLEYSGPIELAGGITCQLTGGHTPGSISIIVPTGYGQACLCGSSAARSCRWRAGADQQLHHRGTAGDRCRQTRLAVPLPAACPRRAGRSRSRPAGRPDRW
jgi:glyoxylase-like metal-dependent hydrolase (beta-lactamase superfamily II)